MFCRFSHDTFGWLSECTKSNSRWEMWCILASWQLYCPSLSLALIHPPQPPPPSLIGDILLGVMAHSAQVHSCYCKITERLIETNDYNNRTLSRQAHGYGSFN